MDSIGAALLLLVAAGLIAGVVVRLTARPRRALSPYTRLADDRPSAAGPPGSPPTSGAATGAAPPAPGTGDVTPGPPGDVTPGPPGEAEQPLDALLAELIPLWNVSLRPSDLLTNALFERAVARMTAEHDTTEGLLSFLISDNPLAILVALEALSRRDPGSVPTRSLLSALDRHSSWIAYFALRAIARHTAAGDQVVGTVLARVPELWLSPAQVFVEDFIRERLGAGEKPTLAPLLNTLDEMQLQPLRRLLFQLDDQLIGALREEVLTHIERLRRESELAVPERPPDQPASGGVGQPWRAEVDPRIDAIVEHPALMETVDRIEAALERDAPPSFVLVGEAGTGKTTVMRLLSRRLLPKGWTIIEAQHMDLIAGQKYIGQFEERFEGLLKRLAAKPRQLWYAPNIHELVWTGQHDKSDTGALDLLLPHLEARQVVVIGETDPEGYERILRARPRYRGALQAERLAPPDPATTLDLACRWAQAAGTNAGAAPVSPDTVCEAVHLAEQFLADRAAPGHVLDLLKTTCARLASETGREGRTGPGREVPAIGPRREVPAIGRDDLMTTVSQLTGLPAVVLDDRQQLDLARLRSHFESRVMGQPEAIDCLVDRVAMIKAGLTDPTRPLGVFLFAGPTGTGKTEIAKVLTEFLFSRPERMIRIDMSELQTSGSLTRLFGGRAAGEAKGSLVERIREQPFAVVLLDEFEKANEQVWHMFLQVFDDGRLTDDRGLTVNLRHAIIIMTANIGAAMSGAARLGFTREDEQFRPEAIERAIGETFRREFLNRIDQVIIFRPLSRETMRAILRKELRAISRLRGLRWRDWAIEWDDDAIEFLLEKGFTPDLGARPLRRAIERHLLAPLATVIAKCQAPAGDQFLFVRAAGGGLQVEFVDPDAPEHAPAAAGGRHAGGAVERPPLGAIVLDPRGTATEAEALQLHHDRLRALVEAESWRAAKQAALARTAERDFWTSLDRFEILGSAEYQDRIERVLESAGSLLTRLVSSAAGQREHLPRKLIGDIAQKLYLIDAACADVHAGRPREAFLSLECVACAARDTGGDQRPSWGQTLGMMYQAWAQKRGMNCTVLDESEDPRAGDYRLLLAVAGLGAYGLLAGETGLHVAEYPRGGGKGTDRERAHVTVVPQPIEPPAGNTRAARLRALRGQARAALAALGPSDLRIVRSYRLGAAPIVRDSARGWRTGRLDHVLAGNFDLMASVGEAVDRQGA